MKTILLVMVLLTQKVDMSKGGGQIVYLQTEATDKGMVVHLGMVVMDAKHRCTTSGTTMFGKAAEKFMNPDTQEAILKAEYKRMFYTLSRFITNNMPIESCSLDKKKQGFISMEEVMESK